MDSNVESVRRRLLDRAKRGLSKYGVTTERDDLDLTEWLQHLQDELLDAAVYVERLKRESSPKETLDMCSVGEHSFPETQDFCTHFVSRTNVRLDGWMGSRFLTKGRREGRATPA